MRPDFIELWAMYVRTHSDWKQQHTKFINAYFEKKYKEIEKILQEEDGEKKIAEMYNIKNLRGHPKLFKKTLQEMSHKR